MYLWGIGGMHNGSCNSWEGFQIRFRRVYIRQGRQRYLALLHVRSHGLSGPVSTNRQARDSVLGFRCPAGKEKGFASSFSPACSGLP